METDSVRCNWCEWYGEVERFSEVCPSCNRSGFLSDECEHTEVVECDCGECLGCPIGSRGDMCAACGDVIMNDEGDSNE